MRVGLKLMVYLAISNHGILEAFVLSANEIRFYLEFLELGAQLLVFRFEPFQLFTFVILILELVEQAEAGALDIDRITAWLVEEGVAAGGWCCGWRVCDNGLAFVVRCDP